MDRVRGSRPRFTPAITFAHGGLSFRAPCVIPSEARNPHRPEKGTSPSTGTLTIPHFVRNDTTSRQPKLLSYARRGSGREMSPEQFHEIELIRGGHVPTS